MGPQVFIVFIIFGAIFGVFYLFFSTRNRERLALIEKGVDASVFMSKRPKHTSSLWKAFLLNLAVVLMGVGAGILIALMIQNIFGITDNALFPGIIFLTAGTGLLVGFKITKDLDDK